MKNLDQKDLERVNGAGEFSDITRRRRGSFRGRYSPPIIPRPPLPPPRGREGAEAEGQGGGGGFTDPFFRQ